MLWLCRGREQNPRPLDRKINALTTAPPRHAVMSAGSRVRKSHLTWRSRGQEHRRLVGSLAGRETPWQRCSPACWRCRLLAWNTAAGRSVSLTTHHWLWIASSHCVPPSTQTPTEREFYSLTSLHWWKQYIEKLKQWDAARKEQPSQLATCDNIMNNIMNWVNKNITTK